MKTETMTIGVPIALYARLDRKQIKDRLMTRLHSVDQVYYYPGKRVNIGIRIDEKSADLIRTNAALNDVAITEYTASLLHEGDEPWLENRKL